MKKIFLLCFYSCLGLFSNLGAMTEAQDLKVTEASTHSSDEKTSKATDFSLESINARLAKIELKGKCFSLKLEEPVDMGKSIIKTITIFHGDAKIGNIVYAIPKPDSGYSITFWRQLYKFTNHGLGMILAIAALADAFQISNCSEVFIDATTEESVKSLAKFGFTKEGEELPVKFKTSKLPEFLKTTAPELLEWAFTKLEKAAQ